MTSLRLQEIRARAEAATPGPWTENPNWPGCIHGPNGENVASDGDFSGVHDANDSDFVANARTDIPDLLDEIDRLQALLKAERAWGKHCSTIDAYDFCRGNGDHNFCRYGYPEKTYCEVGEKIAQELLRLRGEVGEV